VDHDDDLGSVAVARVAQAAALAGMASEQIIRGRAQREQQRAIHAERAREAVAAKRRAAHATARAVYGEAFDPAWARNASTLAAAQVWNAAQPWAGHDPTAAGARHRAEQRLQQLHSSAMRHYWARRNHGDDPLAAMRATVGRFVADPEQPPALTRTAEPTQATATAAGPASAGGPGDGADQVVAAHVVTTASERRHTAAARR
jgi:hypothetical protein